MSSKDATIKEEKNMEALAESWNFLEKELENFQKICAELEREIPNTTVSLPKSDEVDGESPRVKTAKPIASTFFPPPPVDEERAEGVQNAISKFSNGGAKPKLPPPATKPKPKLDLNGAIPGPKPKPPIAPKPRLPSQESKPIQTNL